jgi:hypothetical protein
MDAAEKTEQCEKKIAENKAEEIKAIFAEASARMRELQSAELKMSHTPSEISRFISDYEELLTRFISIEKHDGVAEKIAFCAGEIAKLKAYHTSATYKAAMKEFDALDDDGETDKFFAQIRRARAFRKLAKKFRETSPYNDSVKMEKICTKLYRSLRWKVFKKYFPYAIIFALTIAILIFLYVRFFHGGDENAISANYTTLYAADSEFFPANK